MPKGFWNVSVRRTLEVGGMISHTFPYPSHGWLLYFRDRNLCTDSCLIKVLGVSNLWVPSPKQNMDIIPAMLRKHHGRGLESVQEPGGAMKCCDTLITWYDMAIINAPMIRRIRCHLTTLYIKNSWTFSDCPEKECHVLLEWRFHILTNKPHQHAHKQPYLNPVHQAHKTKT